MCVAALCLAVLNANSVVAQAILRGRVVQDSSGQPIPNVELSVSTTISARSDAHGRFAIAVQQVGNVRLVARRLGYEQASLDVTLHNGDTLDVVVRLHPAAARLDSVVIQANSSPQPFWLHDFDERRRRGIGHFLTDSALRTLGDGLPLANVLRKWGVTVERDNRGRESAIAPRGPNRMSLRSCPLQVYLDGVAINDSKPFDLRGVYLNGLGAVEYYAGAGETPLQFERLSQTCGALVLWSRK